jgi:hypothetical protein
VTVAYHAHAVLLVPDPLVTGIGLALDRQGHVSMGRNVTVKRVVRDFDRHEAVRIAERSFGIARILEWCKGRRATADGDRPHWRRYSRTNPTDHRGPTLLAPH